MNEDAPASLRLPGALAALLEPLSAAAAESGIRIALVGGVVRDRLLGLPLSAREADVVVEGDASDLARRVAASTGARLREHERFGTATLSAPGGWSIDLARARRETYSRPGALPEVFPASLEEDLGRRDFTVNAMALELPGKSNKGRFHDPFGGARDVSRRTLRILHEASFRDDPTRALRAVRYANRLRLRLEPETRRRLGDAVESGALDTVSGDRIRRELERTFSEPRADGAVRLLVSLGIAGAICQGLDAPRTTLGAIARGERLAGRVRAEGERVSWLLPLLLWAGELPAEACAALGGRLSLPGPERRVLERWPDVRRDPLGAADGRSRPARLSTDERIAAAALRSAGPGSRSSESRRLVRVLLSPPLPSTVRGADLLRSGIPAGPLVGKALAEAARALRDGRIRPEEELEFALARARADAEEAGGAGKDQGSREE